MDQHGFYQLTYTGYILDNLNLYLPTFVVYNSPANTAYTNHRVGRQVTNIYMCYTEHSYHLPRM